MVARGSAPSPAPGEDAAPSRRRRRPGGTALAVTAVVLACTAGFVTLAVEHVARAEEEALQASAAEAGSLLRGIGDLFVGSFDSMAAVARAAPDDLETFLAATDREVAGGNLSAVGLVRVDDRSGTVVVSRGDTLARAATGDETAGALAAGALALVREAALQGGLRSAVVDPEGDRRLGFALAARSDLVVYGEADLVDDGVQVADRGPFTHIDVAVYATGPATPPAPDQLVLATTDRALGSRSTTVPIEVGADTFTAVVSARGALAGSLTRMLPALVAVAGTIVALTLGAATELAIRRARERERAARLAEVSAAKSMVMGTVAHELRTSLTVIEGMAAALADQGWGLDDTDRRRFAERVAAQSARLSRLVGDLGDVANLEQGHLNVRLEPTAVGPILEQVACDVGCPERLVVRAADPIPDVLADPDRLGQVVHNLVDNALKYSGRGSTVWLSAHSDGLEATITVTDEGPGIDPDFVPALFTPFERGQSAATVHGSGLGLYVTNGLVQAMGGTIEVQTQPGQGTTMTVRLPHLVAIEASPSLAPAGEEP